MMTFNEVKEIAKRANYCAEVLSQPRLTDAQDRANVARWIQALRSGEYPQTTGTLTRDGAFCCLGVYCEAVERIPIIELDHWEMPPPESNIPLNHDTKQFFTALNDSERLSFEEIADIAEALLLNERETETEAQTANV